MRDVYAMYAEWPVHRQFMGKQVRAPTLSVQPRLGAYMHVGDLAANTADMLARKHAWHDGAHSFTVLRRLARRSGAGKVEKISSFVCSAQGKLCALFWAAAAVWAHNHRFL